MKQLDNYIIEKLKISSKSKINKYSCQPKDTEELREILKERLKEDKDTDLNDIDVSVIVDMSNLFYSLDPHNIHIENWDVSNVEDMDSMFCECENFNCDLSKWNVSNVENMNYMFSYCENFKGEGLKNWKLKKCKSMIQMFEACYNFQEDLEKWSSYMYNMYYKDYLDIFYKCNSLKNKPSWYKYE